MKSTQIYSSLSYSIAPVSIFGVLILGLIFYANGTLEPSVLFLFMIISLGVFGPISKASSYMDQLSSMNVVAGEIKDILDAPELERSEPRAQPLFPLLMLCWIMSPLPMNKGKNLR